MDDPAALVPALMAGSVVSHWCFLTRSFGAIFGTAALPNRRNGR